MQQATTEGKTKSIVAGPRPGTVLLVTKDVLTGGDAARRAQIQDIGVSKTAQAANVFTLLNQAGVPTAFLERHDERSLLCWDCDMLPLEIVMRRYAYGSYLKRQPEAAPAPGEAPRRFAEPLVELFHKHTLVLPPHLPAPEMMDETEARERFLRDGTWPDGVYTDPYLVTGETSWGVHSAKAPVDREHPLYQVPPVLQGRELQVLVQEIVRPAFSTLEEAWARVDTAYGPVALVDCKIEVGRRKSDGRLLLADVVDNDSWRIWPGADPKRQLDKQCFREGEALGTVADNYQLVAQLTERLLVAGRSG